MFIFQATKEIAPPAVQPEKKEPVQEQKPDIPRQHVNGLNYVFDVVNGIINDKGKLKQIGDKLREGKDIYIFWPIEDRYHVGASSDNVKVKEEFNKVQAKADKNKHLFTLKLDPQTQDAFKAKMDKLKLDMPSADEMKRILAGESISISINKKSYFVEKKGENIEVYESRDITKKDMTDLGNTIRFQCAKAGQKPGNLQIDALFNCYLEYQIRKIYPRIKIKEGQITVKPEFNIYGDLANGKVPKSEDDRKAYITNLASLAEKNKMTTDQLKKLLEPCIINDDKKEAINALAKCKTNQDVYDWLNKFLDNNITFEKANREGTIIDDSFNIAKVITSKTHKQLREAIYIKTGMQVVDAGQSSKSTGSEAEDEEEKGPFAGPPPEKTSKLKPSISSDNNVKPEDLKLKTYPLTPEEQKNSGDVFSGGEKTEAEKKILISEIKSTIAQWQQKANDEKSDFYVGRETNLLFGAPQGYTESSPLTSTDGRTVSSNADKGLENFEKTNSIEIYCFADEGVRYNNAKSLLNGLKADLEKLFKKHGIETNFAGPQNTELTANKESTGYLRISASAANQKAETKEKTQTLNEKQEGFVNDFAGMLNIFDTKGGELQFILSDGTATTNAKEAAKSFLLSGTMKIIWVGEKAAKEELDNLQRAIISMAEKNYNLILEPDKPGTDYLNGKWGISIILKAKEGSHPAALKDI